MNKDRRSREIDDLVEKHQGLVHHIGLRIYRRLPVKPDLDDLIGYGMIGLVEAAKKFDFTRGNEFTTFAFPRIQGAIYDGVSKMSWMSRSRFSRMMKERMEAESSAGSDSTAAPDPDDPVRMQLLDSDSAQNIASPEESNVLTQFARVEELEILGNLIIELPNREQRLITMIYIEGLSCQAAAERLGISKSWASRLHAAALLDLANQLRQAT